jgi:hypothetical protein
MEKPGRLDRRQMLQGTLASLAALTASGSATGAQPQTAKPNMDRNYVPTPEDIRISEIMKTEISKIEANENEVTTLISRLENAMKDMTEVMFPDSQTERERKDLLIAEYRNIQNAETVTREKIESGRKEEQALLLPPDSSSYLDAEYSRLLDKLKGLRSAYGLMNMML